MAINLELVDDLVGRGSRGPPRLDPGSPDQPTPSAHRLPKPRITEVHLSVISDKSFARIPENTNVFWNQTTSSMVMGLLSPFS